MAGVQPDFSYLHFHFMDFALHRLVKQLPIENQVSPGLNLGPYSQHFIFFVSKI
jgi:hypothetical protein